MLILSSNHNTQNYPNPFGLGLGLWLCWSWYSFRQVGLLWCLGDAHAWLENYLCGHQQAVKFDDSLSAWGSVKVGIPQGSILGSLLFSVFVIDLPNVVDHAQINMYADDTALHCCGEDLWNIQNDLQFDLCRVHDWLWANRLQLNLWLC